MARQITANFLFKGLALGLALMASTMAWSLKPSHEADRLMLAAEEAFDAGNQRQAEQNLNAALQLGIALPADFNFLYGKLLTQQGKTTEARRYLEQYVNREGDSGKYYRDALSLITQLQKQTQSPTRTTVGNVTGNSGGSGKAEIRRADNGSGSYVENIEKLYGTGDAASALALHLNNLLKFYAYGDERIIAGNRIGTPSRHKIQYSSRGEIISFNKVGTSDETPFTEDRFSVYGVNPQISYECRAATSSCWLYHPVTSRRWLQIVRNEDAALEISKALSQLIRNLQKNT